MARRQLAAVCFIIHTLASQAQPTLVPDTSEPATPVPKADPEVLSFLGYFILLVVLVTSGWILTRLWKHGHSYDVGLIENMKVQVPKPSRLMMTDLTEVTMGHSEGKLATTCLGSEAPPVSHAYLAWRRSQLNMGVILYLIVLILNFVMLYQEDAFDVNIPRDELVSESFLKKDKAKEQLLQFIPLAQTIIAIAFYSASAWRWVSYERSILLVAFGWLLVFFLPFIYFFVPWMDIVPPKEQVQGLCKYTLNLMNDVFGATGTELRLDGGPVDVAFVCNQRLNEMTETVSEKLVLYNTITDRVSVSQPLLPLVGLLFQYIIYLPFLVGAMEAVKSLGPGVLGLMLGLQGGLKMSKLMFPGVRVTSWMLIILEASMLPIVMCIMALLLVVVGTAPVMATAVLITTSMALFLVYSETLMRAVTRHDAETLMTRITRIAIVLQIVGLIFLIMGVYMADHLIALKAQGVAAVKNMLSPLYMVKLGIQLVAGMFVSKVVFVDVVLHIIISTYIGFYEDKSETRQELTSFVGLFPKYESYKSMLARDTDVLEPELSFPYADEMGEGEDIELGILSTSTKGADHHLQSHDNDKGVPLLQNHPDPLAH